MQALERRAEPAWRRATRGEPRLPVIIAGVTTIAFELSLPARVADRPRWVFGIIALVILLGIYIANPRRIDHPSPKLRFASMVFIAILSVNNAISAGRLVLDLSRAQGIRSPGELLLTGAAIWLTNVIVFSLWYWELDRGGPGRRAEGAQPYPDFLFPQMTSPDLAPPDWEPAFVDYFYMSFTNATAFSPTDVMPMSRWAKLTMLLQSAISLVTVVLVIARAVNILK
ncbi:MAG: conserved rane protein of unknown function [Actinomycetia bacterium]|nr:conserved rane protein of unknown function [Actinomycetes bacterium]